jgi:hypothetical protein
MKTTYYSYGSYWGTKIVSVSLLYLQLRGGGRADTDQEVEQNNINDNVMNIIPPKSLQENLDIRICSGPRKIKDITRLFLS